MIFSYIKSNDHCTHIFFSSYLHSSIQMTARAMLRCHQIVSLPGQRVLGCRILIMTLVRFIALNFDLLKFFF